MSVKLQIIITHSILWCCLKLDLTIVFKWDFVLSISWMDFGFKKKRVRLNAKNFLLICTHETAIHRAFLQCADYIILWEIWVLNIFLSFKKIINGLNFVSSAISHVNCATQFFLPSGFAENRFHADAIWIFVLCSKIYVMQRKKEKKKASPPITKPSIFQHVTEYVFNFDFFSGISTDASEHVIWKLEWC